MSTVSVFLFNQIYRESKEDSSLNRPAWGFPVSCILNSLTEWMCNDYTSLKLKTFLIIIILEDE